MDQVSLSGGQDASLEELEHLLRDSNSHDKPKGCDTVTSYASAGIFRTLSFAWLDPLLALGNKKTLDIDDLPQVNSSNSVFEAFPALHRRLGLDYVGPGGVTRFLFAKALVLSAWKEILWNFLLAVIYAVARYVGPYLIDNFVQCLYGEEKFAGQGYILAFTFTAASLLQCLTHMHGIFKLQQVGIRLRAATSTMIYNKCLTLSSQSKQGEASGSGEFINLMAVDADRINNFIYYMHNCWLIILQVILGLLVLYKNLGSASIAALAALVSVMLSNSTLAIWHERFQKKLMDSKDDRMKVTTETLKNMRILKLQGWEMSFLSKILQLRGVESQWLKKYLFNLATMSFVYGVAPYFVAVLTFGSCILFGIPLETGKIFSALATFGVLQEPIYSLPGAISAIVQTKISLGRIASFLSLDELPADRLEQLPFGSSHTAIEIIDGNFTWDTTLSTATLQNINLKVSHGRRVAVFGVVGSGKSSLLSCILGEMPKISGEVKLCGTKAYVAQTPWIQSGTIRENILFGKEMDLERYDKVLKACCLKKDLEMLSFGDHTVIGERGINLSGGQKQRIQIARAVYHNADVYLFDDPFSALDAHTGSQLFKEVLLGLLSEKTVVYVTHQVEFLEAADSIMVMKDGKIEQVETSNAFLDSRSVFMELVGSPNAKQSAVDSTNAVQASVGQSHRHDRSNINGMAQREENEVDSKTHAEVGQASAQLIKEEEREAGSVGFHVYWKYITCSYAGALALLILVGLILSEVLHIGSNYWLAWATPVSKDVQPFVSGSTLISVYLALAIGISICSLAKNLLLVTVGYKTATIFFKNMLQCIFRAPMSFFDATPSGRILNRCSTDQNMMETRIPELLESVASSVIEILGVIVVMAMVAWPVLIIFIPVIFICIWYQQYYIPSARELSRLSGVCEAPVIQYFVEAISGTPTIRSYDKQTRFREIYMKLLDTYSRPEFHVTAAMKWLLLRLDVFSSITFALLLVLLITFRDKVDPAIAGVAVTYGLTLSNVLAGLVWSLSHCGTKMISMERILQYSSIPSEAPLIVEANRPDSSWPSNGEICINNLQVRYAMHLPLVLHGLTCTLSGRMKTGIVGRTGSGKSTLVQTLLRIVEPTTGQILIDGVDISSIGLRDLRTRLSIIPQDPIMFQGTIRSNLDPLEEYTDEQIWESLDRCQLGDQVRKMEKKLDSNVIENGENWSMGQRQLVCLGRVLLKKNKVLILDEATASVDANTDNLIQQRVKEHFSDCTVITVAHRMTSILEGDMVLLLNHGLIEEFDSPTRLLENKSSSFAQLVAAWSGSGSKTSI